MIYINFVAKSSMQIPDKINIVDSKIKELLMVCYKECKFNFPEFKKVCTTKETERDLVKYWQSIPQRLLKKNNSSTGKAKHLRKRIINPHCSSKIHMSNLGKKMIQNFIRSKFSKERIAHALYKFSDLYNQEDIKEYIQSIAPKKINFKGLEPKEIDQSSAYNNERRIERTGHTQTPLIMPASNKLKSVVIPWNAIFFKNGCVWIYNFRLNGEIILKNKEHLVIVCKESRESFNDIKKYFIERLPDIKAYINNNKLVKLVSELYLQDAIKILQNTKYFEEWEENDTSLVIPSQLQTAQNIDRNKILRELKKKKSNFLNYLVCHQASLKNIVPCYELLSYGGYKHEEDTFIFTLSTKHTDFYALVIENVNIARATIAFIVKKDCYDKALRTIYDFIRSDEINKRQRLHNKKYEFNKSSIIDYACINHTSIIEWSYKISQLY